MSLQTGGQAHGLDGLAFEALAPDPALSIQNVRLGNGHGIGIVRFATRAGTYAAVLGGTVQAPRLLWRGPLYFRGDPGERRANAVRTADGGPHPNGEPRAALLIGTTDERARLCGVTQLPLLDAREVTAEGLVPAKAPPVPRPTALQAAVAVEPIGRRPVLSLLTPRGASGRGSQPILDPPVALVDGRSSTTWSSTPVAGGAGDFVTFGWNGHGFSLVALALVFDPNIPLPARLRIHVSSGAMDVPVPAEAAEAGHWLRVTPEAPITSPCLSVEITAGGARPDRAVALAEVVAYSEFDGSAGLSALVDALDGTRGAQAAQVLAQSGPEVLSALTAGWPRLGRAGRARAAATLVRQLPHAGAARLVLEALADGPAGETRQPGSSRPHVRDGRARRRPPPAIRPRSPRQAALDALLERGDSAAFAVLAARLDGSSPPDAALAVAVARTAPDTFAAPVLAALDRATPRVQARLQQAIHRLCRRVPQAVVSATERLVERNPPGPMAAARLVVELGACGEVPETLVATLAHRAKASVDDFPHRFWAVRAAASAESVADLDPWLVEVATSDETWMLRDRALAALAAREAAATVETARQALNDPYPRVRARAVRLLARLDPTHPRLLKHLTQDRWHLVRAEAATRLQDTPQLRAGLRTLVTDRIEDVRVAAISRATALGDAALWPEIERRLVDPDEGLGAKQAGIRFAATLCIQQATDSLVALVRAGLRPGAEEPHAELAVASAAALARLGRADQVEPWLDPLPDRGLQTAMRHALRESRPCAGVGPGPADPAPRLYRSRTP